MTAEPMPYPAGETPGDQPNDMATRARAGNGKFTRDPNTVDRDAQALDLRRRSLTYDQIAQVLGCARSTAFAAVERGMAQRLAEPAEAVRQLELDKLDALERAAQRVLTGTHIVVSNGRVARLGDEPIPDSGPVLQAIATLLRISESRRKLLGLDHPARVTVDGGVRYEVVGVDPEKLT